MALGNITAEDRFRRLHEIKNLLEEGKTDTEISADLGLSVQTIRRNKKYLENLSTADLTSSEIAEKRSELYIELLEAAAEAKDLFVKFKKEKGGELNARRFFTAWLETIQMRAKLFGLDNIKVESYTQVNNLHYNPPEKINAEIGDRIAKMIKAAHEDKVSKSIDYEIQNY
jgi:hypothetical protein